MSEATDTFWAKKAERETLGAKIDAQVKAAANIVYQLSGSGMRQHSGKAWQWVKITSGGGGAFPSHIAMSPLGFDLDDWPDIQGLTVLISQWHSLDAEYRQAWMQMSPLERTQFAAHEPEKHQAPNRY